MRLIQYKLGGMKVDKLRQFVALRESLLREKSELEARLVQINKALGEQSPTSTGPVLPRRVDNKMSLKEAVQKVTSVRPLTKPEILKAIEKIGYRFAAKDPMNSLNVVLYTKGNFKNQSGKFSPLK